MKNGNVKISYVRMEPADNGIIVYWEEKTEKPGKGVYDNCSYDNKKELFQIEEGETMDQCIDRANVKFIDLWKKEYAGKKKSS